MSALEFIAEQRIKKILQSSSKQFFLTCKTLNTTRQTQEVIVKVAFFAGMMFAGLVLTVVADFQVL
jgi:hypothetical protein